MNTHDTLGRRSRTQRNPTGKRLHPTERDILWFEKLHRHGPLSSTYLREYSRFLRKSAKRASDRLTNLYNEDNTTHGDAYLERPFQQFNTLDARYQDIVYDLTPAGERALKEHGLLSEHAPRPHGPWVHRHITACVTASIELATLATDDVRYIFQDEILKRAGTAFRFSLPNLPDLIPDALFGLEYMTSEGKCYRFFLVEADRATEPGRSTGARKSYERTITQYREFVGRGLYKQALALTAGMMVLNVTTNETHRQNLVELTRATSREGRNTYMLYQALPQFGTVFKPPKPLPHLFTSEWGRAGCDGFCISSV